MEIFLEELAIKRAAKKLECKEQMSRLKEELMAAAWHPRRVWSWIKAGRLIRYIDGEPENDYSVLDMMCGYD